jgi:hypothetical protein
MHVYKSTNSKLIHIFQLQKFIIIYLVYICCNFLNICFLLQVDNLNLAKNLDYDVKNEPPYLATTFNLIII